jgi:hypothetical protein
MLAAFEVSRGVKRSDIDPLQGSLNTFVKGFDDGFTFKTGTPLLRADTRRSGVKRHGGEVGECIHNADSIIQMTTTKMEKSKPTICWPNFIQKRERQNMK